MNKEYFSPIIYTNSCWSIVSERI